MNNKFGSSWKIVNTNCIDWLSNQPDNSIDLIITSPPYNLKNRGGDFKMDTYFDIKKNDVYFKEQLEFLNLCYKKIKNHGAFFYNHKNRYEKNQVISPWEIVLKSDFKINQEIIWNRKTTVDYNKSKFAPLDEKIFWLYKKTTYKLKSGASSFTNIWEINRPCKKDTYNHKATFPKELIFRIINCIDFAWNESVLVDTYCGTGTTLQVGNYFGFKKMVGIEIDKNWNSVIEQKINTKLENVETIPIVKKSYKK